MGLFHALSNSRLDFKTLHEGSLDTLVAAFLEVELELLFENYGMVCVSLSVGFAVHDIGQKQFMCQYQIPRCGEELCRDHRFGR